MVKRILAFGDSNTWGWDPSGDPARAPQRWPDDVRWTGVAGALLGPDYLILNEGLNGRTTVWDDPIEEYRCGKDHIVPIMDTQAPLDLVIIFVGSNDLKARFSVTPHDIAAGAKLLATKALALTGDFVGAPNLLLVCPPALGDVSHTRMGGAFAGSEEKSRRLDPYYRAAAKSLGVHYLNAAAIVTPSALDALHLDADQHEKLGRAMAEKIGEILG